MTDPLHPDPHADERDELASAHLDGATSADEAAQIAADPALQARVEELRAVRDAVAALPPVDHAQREAAISAALAAFAQAGSADPSPAPVTSLAAVAARRRPSPARYVRVVGAAAAVVLLAALVPLLGRLGDGPDDDAATATLEDAGGTAGEGTDGGSESAPVAAGDAASPTTTAANRVFLGSFDSVDDLVAAIEDRDQAEPGADTNTFGAQDSSGGCPPEAASEAGPRSVRSAVASMATVAGDAVVAVVVEGTDGSRTLQIFRIDGCELLVERAL